MRPGAGEAFKAAIRRSLPLLAILVLVGIGAVNALKQWQGSRYSSTARVYVSPTDLGAVLTGTQPSFIDPERIEQTDLALAGSAELYARAAAETGGKLGDAADLQAATTVSGRDDNIFAFTAETSSGSRSAAIADAVASEYIDWRADLKGAAIDGAIVQINQRIAESEDTPTLVELLNKLEVLSSLNSSGATVVDRATTAHKISPSPVRDSMLGGAIGLVIALLVVGLREALNTKVRSEADVEDALAVPLLATIQRLPRGARIVTMGRHEHAFGDKYALLATNLVQSRKDEHRTVLAVTSAIAGEGKTTTAANLAVSLARRGAKVVLADFDLRKPTIAQAFGIPVDSPGVNQVVAGDADLRTALWAVPLNGSSRTAVRRAELITRVATGENGRAAAPNGSQGSLLILPAGGSISAGTVAQSPRLPALLDELGAVADFVILDTPPALLTAEMAELSRHVDSVIVVVRQGRVSRRSLRTLSRQAQSWPAEFLGAVVTDTPQDEEHYAYYRGG
jgi:polysaccharide biosynthesis transport protein